MGKRSEQPARNYEVGKGRTPKATRYKPGQSGNLNGRPRGSKNATTLAKMALSRKVVGTVNGKRRRMTVAEVAYHRLGDKAMAGDQKALGFLLMLANNVDPSDIKPAGNATTTEQDLAIIAEYFARQQKKGDSK